MKRIAVLLMVLLAVSGFTTQPLDERKAQNDLPQSHDPLWAKLGKTKITVDGRKGIYNAKIPADLKAMAGKQLTVNGFMLPLEATEKFRHFLLSKRTPTCPFCPPGEPNEIIDVWTKTPIAWNEDAITVTGTFSLMNDQEMGLFFKLTDADIR